MLAEHPDLPAADDVITVREELARGQTVGARQTERERERERERNALSVFSFPLPSCLTFFRTLFSRPNAVVLKKGRDPKLAHRSVLTGSRTREKYQC